MSALIDLSYIAASILFIYGLKALSSPATARKGNLISAVGMLIAVVATLFDKHIIGYQWILAGVLIGTAIGAIAAMRVPMTSMPEFVALFNGFGGIASLIVGWAEYERNLPSWTQGVPHGGDTPIAFTATAIYLAVLIGGVTFTGSMVAYLKLSERISGKPFLFGGQQIVNGVLLLAVLGCGIAYAVAPADTYWLFMLAIALSFVLGVMATIPIGGADMPVVISLLNSYSGLAACAAGFIILNTVLIVSGSLVGASGIILTMIMCKAMNRSLGNVLFSGFGSVTAKKSGAAAQGEAKALSPEDAYYVLEAAQSVVFVPGYGMAVAQAQHVVRELGEALHKNGAEVNYAIHPVAGRMPGHMNVLLAEANVPYEQLVEMDAINPMMDSVDVAIVIGANDVVNPAARQDESSPIYGMPIIDVDKARSVFILKRSMASGFAGIDNPLFFAENARMVFGDAKATVQSLLAQFKEN
ncbi:MAG: NAD(P)(+) transhydrogenase (Re/Si-specific) subunit beta [Candidatus Hydrogenedentes bacterium]|nr:NAD(P)(+) transhydrogenase (Re/Si-specific) subunit beta [Candidatus Hydrogenedentota bacterium]